jgi:hypothetical protein
MDENQRDAGGRFLPGVNGRRTGLTADTRRARLLKIAKDLSERYPIKGLEYAEGDPLAVLLYMVQWGFRPGIPEDEIKAIGELPGYAVKLAARAVAMLSVSERIMCINALLSYVMPKLFATEIKGTPSRHGGGWPGHSRTRAPRRAAGRGGAAGRPGRPGANVRRTWAGDTANVRQAPSDDKAWGRGPRQKSHPRDSPPRTGRQLARLGHSNGHLLQQIAQLRVVHSHVGHG